MKKSLIILMVSSLFIVGCATDSSKVKSTPSQVASQMAKQPEKQFMRVIYTKDIGQVQFDDFLKQLAPIDNQDKQTKAQAKYNEINAQTLKSLKALKVTDTAVKSYLDDLIKLTELSDKIKLDQEKLAEEYQRTGKLSESSRRLIEGYQQQIQQLYQSVMMKEIDLSQQFETQVSGGFREFLYVQNILNSEVVQMAQLQQNLLKDSTIKSEAQFNRKSKPGLMKIVNDVTSTLNAFKPTDAAVASYKNQLINFYRVKLDVLKNREAIQAQQAKNNFSQANLELLNRFELLENQINKTRLNLINKFMK